MAMDVNAIGVRQEGGRNAGSQDMRVMQRGVIIAGGCLALLVAMKIGFLQRIMP